MLKRSELYLYSPSTAVARRKTKPENRGGLNSEEENEIGRQRWEERSKKEVSDGGGLAPPRLGPPESEEDEERRRRSK